MLNFFKKLTDKSSKVVYAEHHEEYDVQKEMMRSENVEDRMQLATDRNTSKEILYYLAEKDPEPKVRLAVAQNKAMPVHASSVLAVDTNEDVRLALAKRLVALLPSLSEDKHSQLYAHAVQSLGTLALDEVLKIRLALSSTLKDHAHAPPKVAGQLARDLEREVSEPVLRFCAALSDEDLLDIISNHKGEWVVEAVAQRGQISGPVSQAVIDVNKEPAGTVLILNEGADISETLLMQIVEKSKEFTAWQKPTATRKNLPLAVAKELVSFVDASIRDILTSRDDFDHEMIEEISEVFQRRIDFMNDEESSGKSAIERVEELHKSGHLNEDAISDAMAARDREFLNYAIAKMAKTSGAQVDKVLSMKAAKPIVALCWKADLSMRLAFQIQKEIGQIQPKDLIYPKDGSDYPMSEEDLNWQLDFLDLKRA